jgi:diguanylate cyclase (GGDEF)-like protein
MSSTCGRDGPLKSLAGDQELPGLLTESEYKRVFDAWRRAIRLDPELSRVAMPDLAPFGQSYNLALTGDDDDDSLSSCCRDLVRNELEPRIVMRMTTVLAEVFTDEADSTSGAVTKSLVSTLGHVCGVLAAFMVSDVRVGARRDTNTALENKLAWEEDLEAEPAESKLLVAMADLDGLKRMNDENGHEAGDQLLAKFAAALTEGLPAGAVPYRLSGDEFGVRFPNGDEEQFRAAFDRMSTEESVPSFSFGISSAPGDGVAAELLDIADQRMYEMKRTHPEARDYKEQQEQEETQKDGPPGVSPPHGV